MTIDEVWLIAFMTSTTLLLGMWMIASAIREVAQALNEGRELKEIAREIATAPPAKRGEG